MTSNLPLVIIIVSINPFLVMDEGGCQEAENES